MRRCSAILNVVLHSAVLSAILLAGCCEPPKPQYVDDTRFRIAIKMVDGSRDTLYWKLPSTSTFDILGSDGTYHLHQWASPDEQFGQRLMNAVIQYKILDREQVMDTIPKRLDKSG